MHEICKPPDCSSHTLEADLYTLTNSVCLKIFSVSKLEFWFMSNWGIRHLRG